MPPSIQPVDRESTPSIIARQLRAAISSGELAPGTQLLEMDLSSRLGVSRGPLREAMQRLTQEGLLVSIRNRGLFVVELTGDDIRDIYLARTAVEVAAAAEIVRQDREAVADRLTTVLRSMERAVKRGSSAKVTEADMEFHETLVQQASSQRLWRMHQTLLTETRMCLVALQPTYESYDDRVAEHRAIVEALRDGDAELAGRLLTEHMQDGLARLSESTLPIPSAG